MRANKPVRAYKASPLMKAAALLFACVASVCLLGCAREEAPAIPSDEAVVREGLAAELEPLRTPSPETMREYLMHASREEEDVYEATYGRDAAEVLSHAFRGFAYEIESVDVAGARATVTVYVRCLDVSTVAQEAAQRAREADLVSDWGALYAQEDDAELVRRMMELLCECMDECDTLCTGRAELVLHRSEAGEWQLDADSRSELIGLVSSGLA